ncbi:ferrous iron transport protein B [Selenomonas sputigena]|uniref:Ferrous iron transport protein B n=1 Tax=Selenomonas sputigena (strain ATCC 35185 / DSM 20758 / CCUG 44933 / VPI D19B-28) TaxID=546271 RepID=C9LXA2_SELS3|nr:ferrous iron transport protein B [Selenomonas sputigena]AEB99537.1 ferrous iron transport protein B [Selenomonas sputigena ATCC 35185]EEX76579.1 ferrous iron transport protein B [Selenomonas sputigena ATCC 35185]
MSTMSVALTGNPNTGKSTIFNELTGMRQKIGNWPGVTVDKKMGVVNYKDRVITVVDLPGTYSINARSAEEQVVIDYFKTTMPDLAVDVIDSSNIERNLFLTVQLLEEGIPLLIDLNMQDEAERKGIRINLQKLEEALGMPVVQTVGRSKKSIQKLIEIFTTTVMSNYRPSAIVEEHKTKATELKKSGLSAEELDEKLIELRYDLIDKIMKKAVVVGNVGLSTSEKIDRVLANGVLALPILLGILYLMFCIAFTWIGQPLADAVGDWIGGPFTDWINDAMESAGVAEWLKSLIADGIVAGVGNVINFVPLIFTLFFMLSFLDGTGYMARVAFIMDPIMRRVGLTGKGIMPLIVGFGCGVPAIMGARALDSEKDRLTSILITPFLTCSAKLPIMALFAAMFFPEHAANLVFSMYIIGIVVAIIMAKVLGVTAFRSQGSTFLLELPPYRMPDMKTVLLETWDKGKGYLIKAGTIIFAMSVGIWFLSNYNADGATDEMSESFLASIGGGMSHLFALHGFETWESGAAVVTGIMAKESVVSTLGILYGVGDVSTEAEDAAETATQFAGSMGTAFTAASALAFMVFSQLYTPCMTSLGTIKKETGKWRWMLFAALYTFGVAWVVSLLVYWGACAFGMNG